MDFDEHPLWKFSLAVYGAPGVAAACLDLQDRRGADVNLVLYAAFVGMSGRGRLGAGELAACRATLASWSREVVGALRQVRRVLKPGSGTDFGADWGALGEPVAALRRRVAALEIEAEKLAQQALAGRLAARPAAPDRGDDAADRRAAALANVRAYLAALPEGDMGDDGGAGQARDQAALAALEAALRAVSPAAT